MSRRPRTSAKLCGLGVILIAVVLALMSLVAATASAASPGPTATPSADVAAVPIPGDWNVTYGSLSVVTITGSNGSYTMRAKTPVQVTTSTCFLPPGTLLATFSGSGGSFSGRHGLWYPSNCSFANWDRMTLTEQGNTLIAVLATGYPKRTVFTKIGTAPVAPTAAPAFRQSVPTPAQITFDPVIVAQSAAIAAGVLIFVPFPGMLFNRTLEANYTEIKERVRRARRKLAARRRLRALVALLLTWARRRLRPSSASPLSEPPTDAEPEQGSDGRFWKTPLGIALFLLLSALLYGFLDPTFGLSSQSLATFAGLAVGLVVTLLAFCVPIAIAYRRRAIPFSVEALPGTLAIGLACLLLTRLTDFHPGYLYGLIVAFVVASELSVAVEGKAMAMATTSTLVVAVAAWFGLLWAAPLTPAQGDPELTVIALQTALVMALVAGVELTVFGMLPLRFLPGEKVFSWNRRVWAALFGIGMFGFVHVLMNPGSGYLADKTRTPMLTIVVLLAFFGLGSVVFWAYFRFRPGHGVPAAT